MGWVVLCRAAFSMSALQCRPMPSQDTALNNLKHQTTWQRRHHAQHWLNSDNDKSQGFRLGGPKERRGLETHLCLELSGMFYSYFYSTTNLKTIKQTARTATIPVAPNHHSINVSSPCPFLQLKSPGKCVRQQRQPQDKNFKGYNILWHHVHSGLTNSR